MATDPTPSAPERVDIERLRADYIAAIRAGNPLAILDRLSSGEENSVLVRLDAALTELSALREATTWRPIAEAPTDGTHVLAFAPGHGEHSIQNAWNVHATGWDTCDERGSLDPTHWLPLPQPPREVQP